jgi:hypothetical protein
MKPNPPPKQTMRVHELAKELGWPSSQLIAEPRHRGEFVKSAMSTLEVPVIRDIRSEFAAISDTSDPDANLAAEMYGNSVESRDVEDLKETFAAALARARAASAAKMRPNQAQWRPPILQNHIAGVVR